MLSLCWTVFPVQARDSLWSVVFATHDRAKALSYEGIFITRAGDFSQSSRLFHYSTPSGEFESVENLEGTPVRWIRHNNQLQCVLTEQKLLISSQRQTEGAFPGVFSSTEGTVAIDHIYSVQELPPSRVAGHATQVLKLEPKDQWRYEYRLYIDREQKLLLRSELYSAQGRLLEQVGFSEISFQPDPAQLPHFQRMQTGWRETNTGVTALDESLLPYSLPSQVIGFRKTNSFYRAHAHRTGVHQTIYSDGFSTVSVFIQKAKEEIRLPTAPVAHGAVLSRSEWSGPYLITVLGEVPQVTLDRFLKAVEWKTK